MKTIGLVGGMSWESTLEYYRIINEEVKARLGGFHSGRLILYSVDFSEIEAMQRSGDWDGMADILAGAFRSVEKAGAEVGLLCTNTMHKVYDRLQAAVRFPILHIADVTATEIKARGLTRVGLLGTKFTMEQDFYRGRLTKSHGIDVLIPGPEDRDTIHAILYNELCLGLVKDASRAVFNAIIGRLKERGAQGVVLGCTEIPLIVRQADHDIPVFDTTAIHARAAVDFALQGHE